MIRTHETWFSTKIVSLRKNESFRVRRFPHSHLGEWAMQFDEADRFRELLDAARTGCPESVNELIANSRDYLLLIANADLEIELHRKVGASDVVQETLVKARNELEAFRGESWAEFMGWLRAILKNDIRQVRRSFSGTAKRELNREQSLSSDAPSGDKTPSMQLMVDEQSLLLNAAMQRLPKRYYDVIRLRNWDQMKFEEIGKQLECSDEAARKLWSRAIFALQKELRADRGRDNV